MKKVLAFLAMMFAVVQTAHAASPSVWEGDLFIKSVTNACSVSGTAAGQFYRAMYNPHSSTQPKPDSIALIGSRSALLLTSTSTTLRGSVGYQASYISANAQIAQFFGSVSYSVKPTTITATTPVVQISGTTSNFGVTGCTITVVAALGLRP